MVPSHPGDARTARSSCVRPGGGAGVSSRTDTQVAGLNFTASVRTRRCLGQCTEKTSLQNWAYQNVFYSLFIIGGLILHLMANSTLIIQNL